MRVPSRLAAGQAVLVDAGNQYPVDCLPAIIVESDMMHSIII